MSRRVLLSSIVCLLAGAGDVDTHATLETLAPIRYSLSFPAPQTHYVEVRARVPTDRRPTVDLMMPVWTPGSYLVRDYSRQVEGVEARGIGDVSLRVTKTAKNHWQVETAGVPVITVSYRVYCREMSERTNWVDNEFALLNGAATYLTLNEPGATRAHDVELTLPPRWPRSISALPAVADGRPHHYRAGDFDTLVDSPILAGNPAVYQFAVDGKPHYVANQGEAGIWDAPRVARDAERIVRETVRFWGSAPYEKYVFLNVIGEAGGALEHTNSTVLLSNRWTTSIPESYQDWLRLVSHEFFHAWNVKRLRPVELGVLDYDREVYTSSLWMAEGITDYYSVVNVRRAALSNDQEFLQDLSQRIRALQTTPGRLVQPVALASFDAWIRHFRPDENFANVAVNFYTKGAVLGFLLDAKIREATNGARSLDDAMRLALRRFGGAQGYTVQDFQTTVRDVAGVDFGAWWHTILETTNELDYTDALEWYGLRFKAPDEAPGGRATFGLLTRIDNGRLLVSQVVRGTSGYLAGFDVDDEILGIDEFRIRPDSWAAMLKRYESGQAVSVLVARRGRFVRVEGTFGREPSDVWRLEVAPNATAEQRRRFQSLTAPNGPRAPASPPPG